MQLLCLYRYVTKPWLTIMQQSGGSYGDQSYGGGQRTGGGLGVDE